MRIEIESQMLRSAREDAGYQPVFRGTELQVEGAMPEASLKNLRVLLKAGLQVASISIVEDGHAFITFTTGETYLAMGFAVGEASLLTKCFAEFASTALGRTADFWENQFIAAYDADHRGLIELSPTDESCPDIDFQPRLVRDHDRDAEI